MNDDNLSRRGATMIDRETLDARQMRRAAPKKLRLRHLPARAHPRSSPFGLAWRAATEQNRLWKPASGESRLNTILSTNAKLEARSSHLAERVCTGMPPRGRA
ncbi:MAG: hypothetical protein K0R61_5125 [Microvirga sp.]|jgi:hypothetical protein|nr:hypothetical protein [Microvirga sp.]MCE3250887.1 hypothetical protein [Geminicoccaceae bacterium]MDF2974675.1 hypothetical protein [Microvirga sp.]